MKTGKVNCLVSFSNSVQLLVVRFHSFGRAHLSWAVIRHRTSGVHGLQVWHLSWSFARSLCYVGARKSLHLVFPALLLYPLSVLDKLPAREWTPFSLLLRLHKA